MATTTTTVRVPQKEGEIRIAVAGDEPRTYKVSDHTVTVNNADLDHFLVTIEGSKVDGAKSTTTSKES